MPAEEVKVDVNKEVKKRKPDEESDEDKELQEELRLLVEKLQTKNEKLYLSALDMLRFLIKTATTSMTSVPKPLKYLAKYYDVIKGAYDHILDEHTRKVCADVISVLAMTSDNAVATKEQRDCLNFCLLGTMNDVGQWGHEYVRQLESEIVEELSNYPDNLDNLMPCILNVIAFDAKHHAEIQACDLLMEIDCIDLLKKHMTAEIYSRVCLYLTHCANYVEDTDSTKILKFVAEQYTIYKEHIKALIIAMQIKDDVLIHYLFNNCDDPFVLKQMAYMAARQQIYVNLDDGIPEKEDLENITYNSHLNSYFHLLASELDILEPKTPEDIYKTWLEPVPFRPSVFSTNPVDSARDNLATSFTNAFVNAGFGTDKLITTEDGNKWIYRNRDSAMMSATASLGLIHLWDVDGGLTPIDKYLYSNDVNIKAGALLALGIVNCRVRNECDPALALLSEYVINENTTLQIGAIYGLGLAYAGTNHKEALELLTPIILTPNIPADVLAITSISCGLIAVSTCDCDVSSMILQKLIDSKDTPLLNNSHIKFVVLGLGLCYLGRKDATSTLLTTIEVFDEPLRSLAHTILEMCAYAGTGDVLIVQEFLHMCTERTDSPTLTKPKNIKFDPKQAKDGGKNKNRHYDKPCSNSFCDVQAIAALGVGVVSIGEDIGQEMSFRLFGHIAQYADSCMRKAVPLAIALCSISNPQVNTIDILNKYSHDIDDEISCNAIFAMGLVGAGTNNARLAKMLRHLAVFHRRHHSNQLFVIRMAQGLVHLGKGTLTLNPFHTDKQLFCNTALGGLLITLMAFVDSSNTIFGKSHYLLYSLAVAMHPRWLITLDEKMEQISVPVRVGTAVDVVAKAGTPKTIAGIHTHATPVLLSVGERAELATDQYEQMSPVMEGIVLLRKRIEQ